MNQPKPQADHRRLPATTTEAESWLAENRAAIEAWNEYVERHGLQLAEFRPF